MAYVDECTVFARAGRGGNGSASLHSEPFKPRGGPDGGDGGDGGSVVFEVSRGVHDLSWLADHPHLHAQSGEPGRKGKRDGASGKDLVIQVPDGTVVFDEQGLLADLVGEGARAVVARGGRGGRGNVAFASGRNRVPRTAEPGEAGEEKRLRVELRTVDDEGNVLPRDGKTSGRLQCRGPWIIKRYFKADEDATEEGEWFDTGDVGTLHPDGSLQITYRSKDVIKSGGEWISSIELENAAVGCPGIKEAAAIGIAHPKWDERPLLVCVKVEGIDVCAVRVREHLTNHVAKWWLPDEIVFVEELPHTATGKILKRQIRDDYKDYRLRSLAEA